MKAYQKPEMKTVLFTVEELLTASSEPQDFSAVYQAVLDQSITGIEDFGSL